jgi:hypothetical protein
MTGDDCMDPFVVSSTPFFDTLNTCDFLNDYDLDSSCTGQTTLGPDVVYAFTPPDSGCWHMTVAVPFGMWDLSLYLLDQCDPVQCFTGSDDYGVGGGEAIWVELEDGVTYYIVVDGREANDCGEYNFGISECVTSVSEDGSPLRLGPTQLQVVPTITTSTADIRFELKSESTVDLKIYNQNGSLVRTLSQGQPMLGEQIMVWNGRDDHGQPVSKGTYFVSLRTGSTVTLKKLTVIR